MIVAMTAFPAKKEDSLQRHMVRGSIWTIGVRWSLRLMGLVSTVILARLLTPADYGIVSIASMIVGMVEIMSQTEQDSAIIRHPNPTREHYDSAWTVSLLLGIGLGLVIWALTPITTAYFHEPRARIVVEILAFRTMLAGSQNIGVVNFRRNLQFNKQFWFNVIPSLVSFTVTIVAALILRNYWSLVIGVMSQHVTNFTLSYVMEPYRPRICFSKVREIWSFSIWSLVSNMGAFFSQLSDRIAIGGFAGSAGMGRYYVATDLATSPSSELVGPMVQVLFPVMATVQHDREKRRELYLTVLYWSALICTSTAIGVALVSDDMVDLVLGAKWQDVKPLMPWLALSYGVLGLGSSVFTAFDTIGLPRYSAQTAVDAAHRHGGRDVSCRLLFPKPGGGCHDASRNYVDPHPDLVLRVDEAVRSFAARLCRHTVAADDCIPCDGNGGARPECRNSFHGEFTAVPRYWLGCAHLCWDVNGALGRGRKAQRTGTGIMAEREPR